MNKILLVTRPTYEDVTEYLSAYAGIIIKEAKDLSIPVKDLLAENANNSEVRKYISKQNPKLLFFNGHGSTDVISGHKDEVILSSNKDLDLLKDRIVYARSCHAGVFLGKKTVENNNGCFIGYELKFSFWMDGKWSATPLRDPGAALCLEPSNEIVRALINGKSASEAYEKSKRMMAKNMGKVLKMNQKNEPGAMGILRTLWNNYEGQVILGNKEARF